jgi:hypothetical protein
MFSLQNTIGFFVSGNSAFYLIVAGIPVVVNGLLNWTFVLMIQCGSCLVQGSPDRLLVVMTDLQSPPAGGHSQFPASSLQEERLSWVALFPAVLD